jgi:PAS domain S-box-containing protein
LTGDITPTRLRVLVLEDRPEDAQLLLYELRQSGYDPFWERVDTELDYLTALDDSFDLILADYSLPQFNAMEALKWLQKRKLDIPFIVVTGSISEEAAVETMKQGASDYLIKDRLGRLGQAVKQALVQKRLRDEKHKVDDALRVSEDRFRSLVQNLSDIITVHTKEGIITYVSPSITRILGYKPNSLMGKAPFEIIHPDDRERITRLFSGVVDGQSSDPAVEIRACRSDGNWIYLEAVATTLLEQDGAQAIVSPRGISLSASKRRKSFSVRTGNWPPLMMLRSKAGREFWICAIRRSRAIPNALPRWPSGWRGHSVCRMRRSFICGAARCSTISGKWQSLIISCKNPARSPLANGRRCANILSTRTRCYFR